VSSSLIEIALDLAAEYPDESPQQIADVIIASIESGSVISQAISHVTIPTPSQLKQAEFRSKRMPSKRVTLDKAKGRETFLEHIENAHFFKHLNSLYMVHFANTGLRPIIGLDGARVTLSPSRRTNTAYQQLPPKRQPSVHRTQTTISIAPTGSTLARWDSIIHESPAHNARGTTSSPLEFLTDIGESIDRVLSWNDIYRIINIFKCCTNDDQVLLKVDEVVRNDVKLRNRESRSDCLNELYRGDDQLPGELRVKRPKVSDIQSMTMQRIKAIIEPVAQTPPHR
jgi:hypothetical protein